MALLTAVPPEAQQVEADERLVDGEALAWEEGDGFRGAQAQGTPAPPGRIDLASGAIRAESWDGFLFESSRTS